MISQTEWLQIRRQVLERDKHTCQNCKKVGIPLEIHHVVPRYKGGLNTLKNLISLCRQCHYIIEGKVEKIRKDMNKYKISWKPQPGRSPGIVRIDAFRCFRCNHVWLPKEYIKKENRLPVVCAKCKNPYWYIPREKPK